MRLRRHRDPSGSGPARSQRLDVLRKARSHFARGRVPARHQKRKLHIWEARTVRAAVLRCRIRACRIRTAAPNRHRQGSLSLCSFTLRTQHSASATTYPAPTPHTAFRVRPTPHVPDLTPPASRVRVRLAPPIISCVASVTPSACCPSAPAGTAAPIPQAADRARRPAGLPPDVRCLSGCPRGRARA